MARCTVNVALGETGGCDAGTGTGGALLALLGGRVREIVRSEGEASVHGAGLVHGVSRLWHGERYSMIIFFED